MLSVMHPKFQEVCVKDTAADVLRTSPRMSVAVVEKVILDRLTWNVLGSDP